MGNAAHDIVRFMVVVLLLIVCVGTQTAYADAGIRVTDEQLVFLLHGKNQIQVIEVARFQNNSSAAQTVKFPLPPGYQAVTVNGFPSKVVNHALILNREVQPHLVNQVILTYLISLPNHSSVNIEFDHPYPVDTAHLYLPIGNMEISAQNLLAATQTTTFGGKAFRVFTRLGIQPGERWMVNIGLLPSIDASSTLTRLPLIGQDNTGRLNTWQAVGNLLVAAFILALGFIGIRSSS